MIALLPANKNDVYLPKKLDEKVAKLHLPALRTKLTVLAQYKQFLKVSRLKAPSTVDTTSIELQGTQDVEHFFPSASWYALEHKLCSVLVCQSSTGFSSFGPCICAAGEEQTYNMSSVCFHTEAQQLATFGPCAPGRFKSLRGTGTPDNRESCPPGTSSRSGAPACTNCLTGMFNDILECASCLSGFFDDGFWLTIATVLTWGVDRGLAEYRNVSSRPDTRVLTSRRRSVAW